MVTGRNHAALKQALHSFSFGLVVLPSFLNGTAEGSGAPGGCMQASLSAYRKNHSHHFFLGVAGK
jgi:hypothetical protein